jgi:cell division topological specificity factor
LLEVLQRLFFRESRSKDVAKQRLRLVLVQDRMGVTPQFMEMLKKDIIDVLTRYVEIDEGQLEVNLTSEDTSMALVANIPVRSIRRERFKANEA